MKDSSYKNPITEEKEYGLLSAEEECALAECVAAGDRSAREKLVCSNMRLVGMVASRYAGVCRGLELDDLKQAGYLGLIRAVDLFDSKKGYRFSTYAVWWIRQAITREIADKGSIIRLPVHANEELTVMRRAAAEIRQRCSREATLEEVAAAVGKPEKTLEGLWKYISDPTVSLDNPIGADGDGTLGDLLPDDSAVSPQDGTLAIDMRTQIEIALGMLSPRENMILRVRFGLDDNTPRTLEEVGNIFGVTRERVRQIESKALKRLRSPKIVRLLKAYAE